MLDLAVIGGGAAGFFAAINFKAHNKSAAVTVFEKSNTLLGKVKISGGGRCNVTHACFNPTELVQFYPRGKRELLSLFGQFGPEDTIQWFASRGVQLKTEADGRMFPVSDNSQTIVNCFLNECNRLNIQIHPSEGVKAIKQGKGFILVTEKGEIPCKNILVASGSSPFMWNMLKDLGHTIAEPVPSLFTFNIKDPLIADLMGLSVKHAELTILADPGLLKKHRLSKQDVKQSGPMLITHWGISGPAALKLSSVGARLLADLNYHFELKLNLSGLHPEETLKAITLFKSQNPKKGLSGTPMFAIPLRLWQRITGICLHGAELQWADLGKKEMISLADHLCQYTMKVNGKSTNKDEFVTAGGIELKEVNFKTMESKLIPGLYFAGEVLNIDALTGGFNFQAAWTEAFVFSKHLKV